MAARLLNLIFFYCWKLQDYIFQTRFQTTFFFNCYLAFPWPTLGHSRGDSLTNPMLITSFSTISTRRSPGDWLDVSGNPFIKCTLAWTFSKFRQKIYAYCIHFSNYVEFFTKPFEELVNHYFFLHFNKFHRLIFTKVIRNFLKLHIFHPIWLYMPNCIRYISNF